MDTRLSATWPRRDHCDQSARWTLVGGAGEDERHGDRPRDAFIAAVSPQLTKPNGRDLVALRVEVQGGAANAWRGSCSTIFFFDEATGISAMMRTTGYSLAITGVMQVDGRVRSAGVYTPDEAVPFQGYVDELKRRGVEIREVS